MTPRHAVIMGVFSTIRSPVFSELVVVLVGNVAAYLTQEAVGGLDEHVRQDPQMEE